MKPNRIHAALREKRKAHGFRLTIPSAETLEILGNLDFDFVLVDDEHGVFGNADLEHICRTADLVGITPIARVPDCSAATIGRRLDRGIRGIVAPHVQNREQAEQVVRSCYFGPLGERSLGGGRGVDYQLGIPDMPTYYRQSNDNMFVAVMIEDTAGMDNIEQICAVQGIHTVLVGNNDFAQGLGYPGDATHPKVKAAIAAVGDRVRKCGLPMREDIWVLGNLVDILVTGGQKFARPGPKK